MSKLKVSAIHDPDNDNQALSIDTSGNVTVSQNTTMSGNLTVSGGFTPATQLSHRNLVINGDMRINQRGSSSYTINSSYKDTLDRFKGYANASDGVYTVEQSTTAPAGFKNSAKITVTTADSSIGATQLYMWGQIIEAQNMEHLNWGTSNAQDVTLSFWVRSSMTGTHGVVLMEGQNSDGCYPTSYTINTADTWEYKTITVPGDTSSIAWQTGINAGIHINFDLGCGSTYRGTANSWTTTNNIYGTTGANELIGTLNATLYITGLQLEVGSVATPFEHRSYGEELAKCQRYYIRYFSSSVDSGDTVCQAATGAGTTNVRLCWNFPVTLRAQPTITQVGTGWHLKKPGAAAVSSTSTATTASNWFYGDKIVMQVAGWSGLGDNYCYNVAPQSLTELSFDSEL